MPDFNLIMLMLLLLLIIGGIAGILAGLLGVGGGIVLVPALLYSFQTLGYDGPQVMQICLGTSLATIIVTSLRSVLGHHKKGAVDWQILRHWAPGIAIGAFIGVMTATSMRSVTLQGVFGLFAIMIGLYMTFGRVEWRLGMAMPMRWPRMIFAPFLGFMSVLMGIGGGSFGVPILTLFNTPIHRAVATASGFGMLIALPGVLGFALANIAAEQHPPFSIGAINMAAFLVIIPMTLITAPIGVRLAHAMNPKPLRRMFGLFLILVALNMLRKSMGL